MAVAERFIPADQIDGQPTPQELFILLMSFYRPHWPWEGSAQEEKKLEVIEGLYEIGEQLNQRPGKSRLESLEKELVHKVEGHMRKADKPGYNSLQFTIEHYRLRGRDVCLECGAAVAHGYCKITRKREGEKAILVKRSNGTKFDRPRRIATHMPYQGFHILGRHESFEGKMQEAGAVIIDPVAAKNFFTHPLFHLWRQAGEPGGAFYQTFRFLPPHE